MEIQLGDKVSISEVSSFFRGNEPECNWWYDNNPHSIDIIGVVDCICDDDLGIGVMWPDGIHNSYNEEDLVKLITFTKFIKKDLELYVSG